MNSIDSITVMYEPTSTGFSAFVLGHPVYTTGATRDELAENIKEAWSLYLDLDNSSSTPNLSFVRFDPEQQQ